MSASKRIAIAVTISWVSRAVSILSGLLLMPILFRFMGKEELGLWFLLGNSQAFLGLLGMGIAPTLTRRIAFAKGKSGSHPDAELTEESKQDIGDWVVTGRTILQWLAVIIFFIAWASGYGLIRELKLEMVSPQTVFWAWTLMCLGYAINVWVAYLGCWLQGIGYVGWDSLIATILAVVTIGANIIAVLMGGGLIALATISVISGLANRFVFISFLRWRQPQLFDFQGRWRTEYAKSIVKPSFLYWLTSLGAFLILRTDSYFISIFGKIDELPSYEIGYKLVSILITLATSIIFSSQVFVSQAWQSQDLKSVHSITLRNAKIAMCVMAVGTSFVLTTGEMIVNYWVGSGNFIGNKIMLVFCVMATLEVQLSALVTSSRATEDEAYAPMALLAGLLNILFTWWFIQKLGLLGVAIGTLLAQILTNDWYAVYRPLKKLKIPFYRYAKEVLSLYSLTLIFNFSLLYASFTLIDFFPFEGNWAVIIISLLISVTTFVLVVYNLILNKNQRKSLFYKVKIFNQKR